MKLLWWRRRDGLDFAEAIGPELRDMPVPAPRDALLERILADREAGVRVLLPTAELRGRWRWRYVVPATIAAVLLLLVFPWRERGSDADGVRSTDVWFGTSPAFAQTAAIGAPRYPSLRFASARLTPMALQFTRNVRDSAAHAWKRDATIDVTVAGEAAAWRVSRTQESRTGVLVETLYVARTDLRPMTQVIVAQPYSPRYSRLQVNQRMSGDSISGEMNAVASMRGDPNPHRTFARRLAPRDGPYISDALAPLALVGIPLTPKWTASASLLGWAVRDDDVSSPISLRVDGEERIRVPAGTFDCWRLTIQTRGGAVGYWVRKSDGVGVRTLQPASPNGAARETVLVRG